MAPPPRQTYPTPTIIPASPSDIARLAQVCWLACSMDLSIRLLFPNEASFRSTTQSTLEFQLRSPDFKTHLVKAVTETGEIMGWCGFLIFPKEWRPSNAEVWGLWSRAEGEGDAAFPVKPDFDAHFQGKVGEFVEEWAVGRRHMAVEGLCTLPQFQRRGVGTALMQWGLRLADKEGIPCFLESTPFARGLYEHIGFKMVRKIDVKLDEWAVGPESIDFGWGTYSWACMVRLPLV